MEVRTYFLQGMKETSSSQFIDSSMNPTASRQKTHRVITETTKWCFTEEELEPRNQIQYLNNIRTSNILSDKEKLIIKLINVKILSYKAQDNEKKLYNESLFVDLKYILCLLLDKYPEPCVCYYCQQPVLITYIYKNEPRQWTMERLDNSQGHNKGNCVVACLSCNIRRRTMYHERFLVTKQLKIVKLE